MQPDRAWTIEEYEAYYAKRDKEMEDVEFDYLKRDPPLPIGPVECDTTVGVTVGLIDGMLSISRILAPRLGMSCGEQENPEVVKALIDLRANKSFLWVLEHCPLDQSDQDKANLVERVELIRLATRTPEQEQRLADLHALVRKIPIHSYQSPTSQRYEELVMEVLANYTEEKGR